MPLDMPESVLVRFSGEMQPGITLRDLVHAIPYYAIKEGMLTVEKKGKKNIFSGRILEIEGLEKLKCEQAFELSDASAERSAAGCTIKLDPEPIKEYITSNIVMLKWMLNEGYGDKRTIERRIANMEVGLEDTIRTPAHGFGLSSSEQMGHVLVMAAPLAHHDHLFYSILGWIVCSTAR